MYTALNIHVAGSFEGYRPSGRRGIDMGFFATESQPMIFTLTHPCRRDGTTTTTNNSTTSGSIGTTCTSIGSSSSSSSSSSNSNDNDDNDSNNGKNNNVGIENRIINTNQHLSKAIESPCYVHEVHLLFESVHSSLPQLEQIIRSWCLQHTSFKQYVQSVHLVDLYVCPSSRQISHVVQISYGTLYHSLSRDLADEFRVLVLDQLPAVLGEQVRLRKKDGRVSHCYPYYVSEALIEKERQSSIFCGVDVEDGYDNNIREGTDSKKNVSNITTVLKNEQTDLNRLIKDMENVHRHYRKETDSNSSNNSVGMNMNAFRNITMDTGIIDAVNVDVSSDYMSMSIEDIKETARALWQRRVGVLVNQPTMRGGRKEASKTSS